MDAAPGIVTTMDAAPGIVTLHFKAARLLAVEVLLTEPEALGDDLEQRLYDFRDNLLQDSR